MSTSPDASGPHRLHLGAAYYHEYHRPGQAPRLDRLRRDLDLMADAGIDLIRVGESVWSTWEPRAGHFELDWLQPVLDEAGQRSMAVILGTPTYAAPPWLTTAYPEIAGETATGTPLTWGARQEMDFTHPAFRFHAERVIRQVVSRYADHPAVVGYQVDNEPGLRLLYNPGIFRQFVWHLRDTYGDVERLNDEWGLVYWSHRLDSWDELWVPDGNLQPQYDLAWRRFQARLVNEYLAWQAGIVREIVGTGPEAPFVTTCISYDQLAVDDVALTRSLDLASANAYYEMQDALAVPGTAPMSADWVVDGTWALYQLADLAYSSKQAPFWVTETNAGAIGFAWMNKPGYDGQLRQVAWALVSRGAQAVEYWNWHTLHYGAETFWGGVLPHDEQPGRTYAQIAAIGQEFRAVGDLLAEHVPDADVAFCYSSDAKWALAAPGLTPLPGPSRSVPDPDSYRRLALPFYRAVFDAGLQVNTVRPAQLTGPDALWADAAAYAARRPVLVVAADFTTSDDQVRWLLDYAAAGGHLVLGPRTAYGDEEGRARTQRQPAGLAEAAGVGYQEFGNLDAPVPLVAPAGAEPLPGGAVGTLWADYLVPATAQVIAGYDDPHLGAFAAVTTHPYAAGRITVVGTVLDQATGAWLLGRAVPEPVAGWGDLPESVRVTSTTGPDGSRAWFVHHWGWGEVEVGVPVAARDLVDGSAHDAGGMLRLGPWDVRVLGSV